MDRSFLSQPAVIAASRRFVCARLTTYEDEAEGKFLKALVRTGSGELENSAFCIFAPDAKEKLVRAGRSMKSAYADARAMADGMDRLADRYKPKAEPSALPLVSGVRLALDVAAADNLPLVVVVAKDKAKRKELEAAAAKLAWDPKFVGRFVYAACGGDDLAGVKGADATSVLLVVQPDRFGLKGKVLAQAADAAKLADALTAGGKAFAREEKGFRTHVRDGQREGVFWETKTPVTDPMEAAARERGRRK